MLLQKKWYDRRSQIVNCVSVLNCFTSIKHPIYFALSPKAVFLMSHDFHDQNCPLEKRAVTQGGIDLTNQICCQVTSLKEAILDCEVFEKIVSMSNVCIILFYFIIFIILEIEKQTVSYRIERIPSERKRTYVRMMRYCICSESLETRKSKLSERENEG